MPAAKRFADTLLLFASSSSFLFFFYFYYYHYYYSLPSSLSPLSASLLNQALAFLPRFLCLCLCVCVGPDSGTTIATAAAATQASSRPAAY